MEPVEDGHEQVMASTRAFIGALKATGAARRFVEAARRYDSDLEAQSLVKKLQDFQVAQRTGGVLSTPLEEVRDAQQRYGRLPAVREYVAARDALGSLLRETNVEISQILGVDFGQAAGPAGGCCGGA